MLRHHRLDHLGHFFLLATGQLGGGLENQLQAGLWLTCFLGLGGVTPSSTSTLTPRTCASLGSTSPRGGLFPTAPKRRCSIAAHPA